MTKIPHDYSINGIKLCTIEMDEKVVPFTREELQKRIELSFSVFQAEKRRWKMQIIS